MLIGILFLMIIGFLMVLSAGPYAARRIGAPGFAFLKKFLIYTVAFLPALFYFSTRSKKTIILLSILGFAAAWGPTASTLIIGSTIKGASRWINLGGFGLQPSELMKPFFIILQSVTLVKITSLWHTSRRDGQKWLALHLGILGVTILPLLLQPDLGMTFTFLVIWGLMIFVAGLPWKWVTSLCAAGAGSLFVLYNTFGHFKSRIDRFISPENADTYQIDKALEAVKSGGWLPNVGNGFVKESLPDSHADFVFVVFVEEFGALLSLTIIAIYLMIFLRGLRSVRKATDDFVVFAGTGLLGTFIFQAFFNIASNLSLVPTKGMTLPFLSYGGSSFASFAIIFGMLLSLLRKE
ncbi:MAG: FtsW/RodA/SpoVE family cell cycle protein [Alphaproteobacteria bacterium]|nr:FtsW/RodA/SpoVE family cell cycle protein [Alphaproteobacteria bacterium]